MKKKKNKLQKIRLDILNIAKKHVIINGWNDKIIDSIANKSNFKSAEIIALFPKGYKSILKFYLLNQNDEITKACNKINLNRMKIHERIREIILLRLKINQKDKKLIRKTLFTLLLPQHSKIASTTLYSIVDQIWFIAGDNSTDFNFYSKRAILALIYSSTILYWLSNNNKNLEHTEIFLNKQLKRVSKIPKIKQKFKIASSFLPNFLILARVFKR